MGLIHGGGTSAKVPDMAQRQLSGQQQTIPVEEDMPDDLPPSYEEASASSRGRQAQSATASDSYSDGAAHNTTPPGSGHQGEDQRNQRQQEREQREEQRQARLEEHRQRREAHQRCREQRLEEHRQRREQHLHSVQEHREQHQQRREQQQRQREEQQRQRDEQQLNRETAAEAQAPHVDGTAMQDVEAKETQGRDSVDSSGYQKTDPMYWAARERSGRYDKHSDEAGCCGSSTGGCCFSTRGGCCFSDREGCMFSDREGCAFSDRGGCLFSDLGGAWCSTGSGCCCSHHIKS